MKRDPARPPAQTMLTPDGLHPQGAAIFGGASDEYRYRLERTWEPGATRVLFIMLNPSIGTATVDDPTLRRCAGYTRRWGYAGYFVCNLFALRSTDPSALYAHPDPVGPENDTHIRRAPLESALTVLAWGTHGEHMGRGRDVAHLLAATGKPALALHINGDGSPGHPLYLPGDARPMPFDLAAYARQP